MGLRGGVGRTRTSNQTIISHQPQTEISRSCLSLRNGLSLWDLSNDREVRDLLLRVLCLCRKNPLAPLTFGLSGDDDFFLSLLGVMLSALMWDCNTPIYKLARKVAFPSKLTPPALSIEQLVG
jgi:hypothetical protein